MAGELTDFGKRVSKIVDPPSVKRIVTAGGMAGKKAALEAASDDLGGDRTFSGMGRKVRLGAGFDPVGNSQVLIKFRPPGLWKLADTGRRGGKVIRPRRRPGGDGSGHAPALRLPDGSWRATSKTGRWGGKGTLKAAVRQARVKVPRAAHKQFAIEVRRVVK